MLERADEVRRVGYSLRSAASFVRLSALGGTLILLIAGAAAASPLDLDHSVRLIGIGLAFHIFAYVLNDVIDVPIDRTEPRRINSPLVRGVISPRVSLAIALAQVPLALLVARHADPAARGFLASAFILLACYDIGGKRCRFPPLTDFVQGAGWGCLCAYGSLAAGRWTVETSVLVAFVVVFIVMANGVHGALRDILNDSRFGVRSTAIFFGARAIDDEHVAVPSALRRYAIILHIVLIAIVATALAANTAHFDGRQRITVTLLATVLVAAGSWFLSAAARSGAVGEIRPAGMMHLVMMLSLVIVVVWYRLSPSMRLVLMALYLAPLLAHGWLPSVGRWTWRSTTGRIGGRSGNRAGGRSGNRADTRPRGSSFLIDRPAGTPGTPATDRRAAGSWRRSIAAVWTMTRPENLLAAAAVTVIGAYLGGGGAAIKSAEAVIAAVVVALVLGSGNILNDCYDLDIDRFRKAYRPLPAGEVTIRVAATAAWGMAGVAVAAALALGRGCTVVAVATVGTSWMYSAHLKRTVFIGNITIGVLTGATVVFGALATSNITAAVWWAAGLIVAYFVSFEVLKSCEDIAEDSAAGARTIATVLGRRQALVTFRCGSLVVILACTATVLLGPGSFGFAVAAAVGTAAPLAVANVLAARSPSSLLPALWAAKAGWFASLPVIAILR